MGFEYTPVTEQLYLGANTNNHNVHDYPVIYRNSGNPWSQSSNVGQNDAVYARFDASTLVGVNEINSAKSGFLVYPNPADKSISLSAANLNKCFDVILYNSSGQAVSKNHFSSYTGNRIEITTDNLNDGLYLAKLILSDGKTLDQKFIIQK